MVKTTITPQIRVKRPNLMEKALTALQKNQAFPKGLRYTITRNRQGVITEMEVRIPGTRTGARMTYSLPEVIPTFDQEGELHDGYFEWEPQENPTQGSRKLVNQLNSHYHALELAETYRANGQKTKISYKPDGSIQLKIRVQP